MWRTPEPEDTHIVADALAALERMDPGLAQLVDLRFFGGLSFAEIAKLQDTSPSAVQRDWERICELLRA